MDRDPNALTDDVKDFDAAILALDPRHFWKLSETTSTYADSGFGNAALTVVGSPTRGQATGLTSIAGIRFASGSYLTGTLPASTTSFSALALVRLLTDYTDASGMILGDHAGGGLDAPGWWINQSTLRPGLHTLTGFDYSDDLGQMATRTLYLLGIAVDAGVARWYLNGVPYAGGDGSDTSIESFTPTRIGAIDASTGRLRADLARLAYLPGVVLTDEDFATVYAARFSCHAATLIVVNTALAHVGQSVALTNLSTETTPAAVAARLHYPTAVESVLRDFNWPFAARYATLDLVDGAADDEVNSDWTYAYRAPDRMVRPIRVVQPGLKRAFDPKPPPFARGQDALGDLIFTDQEDAELEYTTRPVCPASQGDVLFREALAWYLAALFVPALSKNELTQDKAFGLYAMKLALAKLAASNEDEPQDQQGHDPDWISNR